METISPKKMAISQHLTVGDYSSLQSALVLVLVIPWDFCMLDNIKHFIFALAALSKQKALCNNLLQQFH